MPASCLQNAWHCMAMVANLDDTSVSSPAGFGFEALPTQIQGWANICAGTDFQGHCGFSVKPVQSPRCTVLKIRKYKKYMTASQQIRCTRYTKWIQMDNEWTWKMKLGSSMISKLKMLKMLKQLSTLIPGLAPQNSPSWSGDHLVVNQKLKQLPQSGHRRAQGCYRLLSQVTVSNARPAKTSTYINHAFHNMVIDHRSLYKFVLLHQIPSLHPSFGANPYRMDFGRLSVATVISVCHRISIKLVQTTDPGSSRATRLPTRSIQYLYAQKARFAHTTFEGLQRILTQGNLKDGLKECLGNHQIPPQFNFICKGIFNEFRGYALGLMRLLMMMMTRYDIILIML